MFLNFLFTLFLTQNNSEQVLGNRGCGLGPEDIFFINSNDDFNQIQDCSTVNGSIFINGDYNIQSLNPMTNIENIEGYLVIYDSHTLMSLKGLHSLQNIRSYNPYLLQYGVAIKYNDNPEDSSAGLCFANLVNWTKITGENVVVSNNKVFCPDCHLECHGCFGPGRLLCQECINYRSGTACLNECPQGTSIIGNNCIESLPSEDINLNFGRQEDEYQVLVSWEEPETPNGFILNYRLYRDNQQIFTTFYDNDGYYSNDNLTLQYLDLVDGLDTTYYYRIEYTNSVGSLNCSISEVTMYNRIPSPISNLQVSGVTNVSASISWNYPETGLNPIFQYKLNQGNYQNINLNETITELQPYYSYEISLRATYNFEGVITYGDVSTTNFVTQVGIPPVPRVPIIEGNLLTWEQIGVHRGPILYYCIFMNNTVIYNGTYLEEGLNLNDIVEGSNSYSFYIEGYTKWDLGSRSVESPLIFFDTTTTSTTTISPTPTTNFLGHDMWENWVWYIIIICSSVLGILLIVLLFCCCRTPPPSTLPTRPSIYNPAYESVNVKRNNIRVDEIERGAIKNDFYQPMEFEEDEKVFGFRDNEDTDSVEYLHIVDNDIPPPPPNVPTYSKPRRRRSENTDTGDLNNNLKNDTNYQNTAKRKMSLLDELKEKIPEMVPKNMME
jgi:hypothetical protein